MVLCRNAQAGSWIFEPLNPRLREALWAMPTPVIMEPVGAGASSASTGSSCAVVGCEKALGVPGKPEEAEP